MIEMYSIDDADVDTTVDAAIACGLQPFRCCACHGLHVLPGDPVVMSYECRCGRVLSNEALIRLEGHA